MKAWGSAASVIAALRDDAAAEMERLEREADAALSRLRASVVAEGGGPDPAPRLAAARRTIADLAADEDWQDTLTAAAERDAWIEAIVEQGRRAIAHARDALAWTSALAEEAVRHLPGSACVVMVPEPLLALTQGAWRQRLEQVTGKTIVLEAGPFIAGCQARTPDGKVTFDNRIEAREARTRAEWRGELARAYESAVADVRVLEPA